jgi:hypothetical protein
VAAAAAGYLIQNAVEWNDAVGAQLAVIITFLARRRSEEVLSRHPHARWETLQNLTLDEKVAHLERAFVWHLVKKHRIEVSRLKQRVG